MRRQKGFDCAQPARVLRVMMACVFLSACSQTPIHSTTPEDVTPDFGGAVRAMVREQTCIKNTYCTGSAGGRLEGWEAEQILKRYQASSGVGG